MIYLCRSSDLSQTWRKRKQIGHSSLSISREPKCRLANSQSNHSSHPCSPNWKRSITHPPRSESKTEERSKKKRRKRKEEKETPRPRIDPYVLDKRKDIDIEDKTPKSRNKVGKCNRQRSTCNPQQTIYSGKARHKRPREGDQGSRGVSPTLLRSLKRPSLALSSVHPSRKRFSSRRSPRTRITIRITPSSARSQTIWRNTVHKIHFNHAHMPDRRRCASVRDSICSRTAAISAVILVSACSTRRRHRLSFGGTSCESRRESRWLSTPLPLSMLAPWWCRLRSRLGEVVCSVPERVSVFVLAASASS